MNNKDQSGNYQIRAPYQNEIPDILSLFAAEVKAGFMLPRSKENVLSNIQNWKVASFNQEIIGCVSLVFFNKTLCEIRSLAVAKSFRKNGLGKKLVEEALILAKELGAREVLTLTRAPRVFESSGFQTADIRNFPEKVRQDCKPCHFINNCDEIALLHTIKEGGVD
jgi:N-acetylglutamate synthase-like GNAT family acetyltransferase